uniref:Uncharacterized protein n=1 Tax=Solanum lycopersicum TaxID=4081 RepID=A0A3Q7JXM4_SOLLC
MAGGDFPNPSLDFFLELEKELKELLQANVLGYQDFIWAINRYTYPNHSNIKWALYDEEDTKWEALEKLPTFYHLRKGLLFKSQSA